MCIPTILFVALCGTLNLSLGSASNCRVSIDQENEAIFTKSFGNNSIVLSTELGAIEIIETETVYAHCPNGFPIMPPFPPTNTLQLFCDNGDTRLSSGEFVVDTSIVEDEGQNEYSDVYQFPRNRHNYQNSQNLIEPINKRISNYLKCNIKSLFHEDNVKSCEYGLVYGLNLGNTTINLADVCFDTKNMQITFIHYINRMQSHIIINNQEPNKAGLKKKQFGFLERSLNGSKNESLMETMKIKVPYYSDFLEYRMDYLVPIKALAGPFEQYISDFDAVSMIAWWKTLKFGNWRLIENALLKISKSTAYEVYAGVSKTAFSDFNGQCFVEDLFIFEVDGAEYNVPLYVWNYVKVTGSDSDDDADVVIVGVNSPFLMEKEFCEDKCATISWLDNIYKLLKRSTMGQVFCCRPRDVSTKLDGFPVIVNENESYSTTPSTNYY